MSVVPRSGNPARGEENEETVTEETAATEAEGTMPRALRGR